MARRDRGVVGLWGAWITAAVVICGWPGQIAADDTDADAQGDRAVAQLEARYRKESNTREWEMLDFVGCRMWREDAARVVREHPEAVRRYVTANDGSEVADELIVVLGDAGGKENVDFLIERAAKKPTWALVIALGRTNDPRTWPSLRKVMTGEKWALAPEAAFTLARAQDREIIPTLKAWLASNDAKKLGAALRVAQILAAKDLLPALREAEPRVSDADRDTLYLTLVACGDDKYLDKVHERAVDDSEYIEKSKMKSPDPAMVVYVWNYRQNQALDAIAKLASPRSLPTLDRLAAGASDPNIRKRATEIAKQIRKQSAPSPA